MNDFIVTGKNNSIVFKGTWGPAKTVFKKLTGSKNPGGELPDFKYGHFHKTIDDYTLMLQIK